MSVPDDYGLTYRRALLGHASFEVVRLGVVLLDLAYTNRSLTFEAGNRLLRFEAHLHGRSLERARESLTGAGLLVGVTIPRGRGRRTLYELPEKAALERSYPDLADAAKVAAEKATEKAARKAAPERPRSDPDPRRTSAGQDGRPTSGWVYDLSSYTGARVVRGTHGITHVYDPLGRDRPPVGWPHDRPSKAEIRRALEGADNP
jgi:hypothetical protein